MVAGLFVSRDSESKMVPETDGWKMAEPRPNVQFVSDTSVL